jgi:hypothetical protein
MGAQSFLDMAPRLRYLRCQVKNVVPVRPDRMTHRHQSWVTGKGFGVPIGRTTEDSTPSVPKRMSF